MSCAAFPGARQRNHSEGLTMQRAKIKIVTSKRIVGVIALARELGVTREHLYRVMTGRRESRRLVTELRNRGIKVEVTQ